MVNQELKSVLVKPTLDSLLAYANTQPDPTSIRFVESGNTKVIDYITNLVLSNSKQLYKCTQVGNFVAIDLSMIHCKKEDWELLVSDPYRSLTLNYQEPDPKKSTVVNQGNQTVVKQKLLFLNRQENELAIICATNIPIVTEGVFIHRLTTSIDGGLYYALRGVPATQSAFINRFAGMVGDEQRSYISESSVTAKPRLVITQRGTLGAPAVNQNLVTITQDQDDRDVQAIQHPLRSLESFKFAATEIIIEMANGLPVFGLFNAKGERQASAPDSVVRDSTVPAPFTNRLQACISCIRCHDSNDMWKPLHNDLVKLKPVTNYERIADLYNYDADKALTRARDDYSDTIVRLAGLKNDHIAKEVTDLDARYWYDRITYADACKELYLADIPINIIDDPIVLSLRNGLTISRREFEQVYAEIIKRIEYPIGSNPELTTVPDPPIHEQIVPPVTVPPVTVPPVTTIPEPVVKQIPKQQEIKNVPQTNQNVPANPVDPNDTTRRRRS